MDTSILFIERYADLSVENTAVFDKRFLDDHGNRIFRYSLIRTWRVGHLGKLVFVMLNPSVADARINDSTVRKCMVWAQKWGYRTLEVVNLFSFRSKSPKIMKAAKDPVGPLNDEFIGQACREAELVICAWGAHGTFQGRANHVVRNVLSGVKVHALKRAEGGQPWHPLYLRNDSKPFLLTFK